jgi:hypothetical protein
MSDEIVNLYCVGPVNAEYSCFVFASTANKARALCVNHFSDDEAYIDMRAYLRQKNVGGQNNVIVDSDFDKDYGRVTAAGCYYSSEDYI